MILLSHPTANQNVRQAALAFAEAGLLDEFWTCLHWKEGSLPDRALAAFPGIRNELRRRSFPPQLEPFVHTASVREWGRQLAGQAGWPVLTQGENGPLSIDAVYRSLDRRVARRLNSSLTSKAVYAYDDGALHTFQAARRRGLLCVYEHPIVHWRLVRRTQEEEAELHPEWAPTLGALADSAEKLARKDEELGLADVIITPSTFARESITSAPGVTAPVYVIPYGTKPVSAPSKRDESKEKLRVIFVGALSQAKGLGYLLEAVARLSRGIEFTLVGRQVSREIPTPATLAKYRWLPSLPHAEVLEEMSRHDVLVLPSLNEGFGLVINEAMSQGLVVITTSHTAGPDLIDDSIDGFVVPIRSADAIEEKLELLGRDRVRLCAMQEAARRKARSFSWENYRQRLVQLAREVMGRSLDS